MKIILRMLYIIFGGLFKMSKNHDREDIIQKIEKQVEENHKRIIEKEQIQRDKIDETAKYMSRIIERDKKKYAKEISEKREAKDRQYKEIEKELDKAINEGNIECIKSLTKKWNT